MATMDMQIKKEIQETLRIMVEKYEDTKGVIRSRKLKDDMQYNGQKKKKKKDKHWSAKHYTWG